MEIEWDYVQENEASRAELREVVARLDAKSFQKNAGSSWNISSVLCHLAFWDQRIAFLLKEWRAGRFDQSKMSPQTVESVNAAVNAMARFVPGPAAAKLALESAEEADALAAEIGPELAEQIVAAGFERYLRRSLHRREHVQRIREALDR